MKFMHIFGILLVSTTFGTIVSHKFGTPCDLNTDCNKGLACDVRHHPISNTCLVKFGGTCHKDLDCVNGLECKNGRCGCDEHAYYERNDCIPKQIFGETCKNDDQCSDGLVCSSRGYLVNVCLGDLGGLCSQDTDCANKFKCIIGKCTCAGQYETYNSHDRDCELIKFPNEREACINNKDCKSDRLACDRSINGNKTFSCARVYGEFCQVFEDCANGLQCGTPGYTCECQSHQYYDYIEHDCLPKKQFKEECNENYKCADHLVCDVRVEPTLLSQYRSYECRKKFGNTCKSNNDCANFLSCNDGICGCPANHFYNEDLNDCFPQQEFGQPCESNIECLSDNLACDLSPTGDQTKMCSYLPGVRCSDSNDCVHGLDCIHGHCKCKGERHFNYHTFECEHYRDIKKKSLNEQEQLESSLEPEEI